MMSLRFRRSAFAWVLLMCSSHLCFAQIQNTGKQIFTHHWSPMDPNSPHGDGLGPVFNARSCAECHHQGGVGGGGDLKFNFDLVFSNPSDRAEQRYLSKIHPGFREGNGEFKSSTVLHRFGLDQAYTNARTELMPFDGATADSEQDDARLAWGMSRIPLQFVRFDANTTGLRIQRNTPALFGVGLIDKITLRQLTDDKIETRSPNVSGRPPLLVAGKLITGKADIGRFGWRGQVNSLTAFVALACATELGLENSINSQSFDPREPDYQAPGPDISNSSLAQLVDFVRSLPRPEMRVPQDEQLAKRVYYGKNVFHEVGCTDCHVENRAGIREIYSDLLLHDMGPRLADPILPPSKLSELIVGRSKLMETRLIDTNDDGAFDVIKEVPARTGFNLTATALGAQESIGSYGGSSSLPPQASPNFGTQSLGQLLSLARQQEKAKKKAKADIPELAREWRTPPLWGVASSAPYMHDGRAATLLEAILLHGGEAQDSVDGFLALNHQDQSTMIEFLRALQAPIAD